jgi:HEAT repeat protein
MDSDFMERHCMEVLEKLGPEEALDEMQQRAQRRDKAAIRILGKIGSEEPVETLVDYVDADSDPELQKATFRALGEIGSQEATQPLANKLVADSEDTRSRAARALGLLGDTRAISPLADVLADEEEADRVRASAAWALNQIGTEAALEEVSGYVDDRAFIVQAEAEKVA